MWIKYKLKKDRSFEDVAKEFKNTEISLLLKQSKNNAAAKFHKSKKLIPAGTVVWLLDPKAKVYVMPTPKGKVLLTEKEWKDNLKIINTNMKKVLTRVTIRNDSLNFRYKLQDEVNKDFPIIAFFVSNWYGAKGNKPTTTKKNAAAAVKKLKSVVNAQDYKGFEPAVKNAEKAVNAYSVELYNWIEQLIGSSENWVDGLDITADISFAVTGACAVTIIAPATTMATVLTGMKVGAGVSFIRSFTTEVAKASAGNDVSLVKSAQNIGWSVIKGGTFGAAGGAISKWIAGKVAVKMAEKMQTASIMNKFATRLVQKSKLLPKLSERVVQSEIKAIGELAQPITLKVHEKVVTQVVAKVIIRSGTGSTSKVLEKVIISVTGLNLMEAIFKKNSTKIGFMTEQDAAAFFTEQLLKHPQAAHVFHALVKENMKEIEAELTLEINNQLKQEMKKIKKNSG